ncbi:MAG TPA: acyl-CoA synthetase [Stellaceae bacterium]|nr:acyl-CoA synthetase [Stellaceae bacterium]
MSVPPVAPLLRLGEEMLTRDALLAGAGRAASGFAALGIGADDAVALLLRNDFPFFEASLGTAHLGAYAVPFNWHASAHEVAYLLKDCGARVLVAHADLLHLVETAIPPGVKVLAVEPPPPLRRAYRLNTASCRARPGATLWRDWLMQQSPWQGVAPVATRTIIYTSGTTGQPKGVRRQRPSAEQLADIDAMRRSIYGIEPGGRVLLPGPIYHSAPNSYGLAAARVAERLVLMPRFDPEELLRLIEHHRITAVMMVPTMFVRLLKLPDAVRRRYDLSSLRFVIHASAPCPVDVKRAMIDWWGLIINEFYGGTETGVITFCTSEEWLSHPGTVGRVVDKARLVILDDHGRPCSTGVAGEVYMRLSYLPDFTYHGQEARRREVERDGLVTLGDVGYLDADGYLYICDRKRDMAIIGGSNVYPAEIEAVLVGMAGIRDCAVFGIPDIEYGEALMAVVEPEPGAGIDAAAVHEYLRSFFSGFKLPRHIEIRDTLPREDSGKIFKRQLRAPFWEKVGRSI